MTMLVSWIGVDTHGPTSAYIAADSRISWDASNAFDFAKKVFAAKKYPEIFGYAGDVLFPFPNKSGLLCVLGSGPNEFNKRYLLYQKGTNSNTSRNVFQCFTDTLANMADIRCGGAPHLVGLIRKPLTYGINFGIISEGKRYFLGMEIPNKSCFINVEWRNKFFEVCDGSTKKIKEGAAHQPNPMLKKSATP